MLNEKKNLLTLEKIEEMASYFNLFQLAISVWFSKHILFSPDLSSGSQLSHFDLKSD